MALQRIRIVLDKNGIGHCWIGDKDIAEFVTDIEFLARPGTTPQVCVSLKADVVEVKADAEVIEEEPASPLNPIQEAKSEE